MLLLLPLLLLLMMMMMCSRCSVRAAADHVSSLIVLVYRSAAVREPRVKPLFDWKTLLW
jgi:hypothetical protein